MAAAGRVAAAAVAVAVVGKVLNDSFESSGRFALGAFIVL
jgi:hypothetical protein